MSISATQDLQRQIKLLHEEMNRERQVVERAECDAAHMKEEVEMVVVR